MAFVTRADRTTAQFLTASHTSDKLGPGTYAPPSEHKVVHAYAPFSSTSERKITLKASSELVTPGPGAYGGVPKPLTSPTANPLNQTAPRWKPPKSSEAPGPGAYDLPVSFKQKKRPRSAGHRPNVVWFRSPTAPSIPIPSQAHGYEETQTGELVPQKPPIRGYTGKGGDSVGPGGYNVLDAAERLFKAKGTDFGKSRSQRLASLGDNQKEVAPGPGQYDWAQAADPAPKLKRPTATFVSRVLRAHQKPKQEDEELPGPGAYDAHLYHALKPKVVPEVLQCFGSTSRRSDLPINANVPGPGSYKVHVDSTKRKPLFDANRAPFASSSSRFYGSSEREEEIPGPGQYVPTDFISENQKTKFGRGGHFGSTARRFEEEKKTDDDDPAKGLGPGSYEFKQPKFIAGILRKGPSSVFASSSERFEKIRKEKEVRPAPGQYQIAKDWTPSLKSAKPTSFTSSAPRFKNNGPAAEPGPGSYNAALDTIEHRLVTRPERPAGFGIEPRFKSPSKTLPVGPGTYNPVDPYGGLVKRSFNVTIESAFI